MWMVHAPVEFKLFEKTDEGLWSLQMTICKTASREMRKLWEA